jgi:hypothetical protein
MIPGLSGFNATYDEGVCLAATATMEVRTEERGMV